MVDDLDAATYLLCRYKTSFSLSLFDFCISRVASAVTAVQIASAGNLAGQDHQCPSSHPAQLCTVRATPQRTVRACETTFFHTLAPRRQIRVLDAHNAAFSRLIVPRPPHILCVNGDSAGGPRQLAVCCAMWQRSRWHQWERHCLL